MVCRPPTCFGIFQAPGTSVSRGVSRNALVKASERHEKERRRVLGVNEKRLVLPEGSLNQFLPPRFALQDPPPLA